MATKVRLEINTIVRQNGGPTTRMTIKFFPSWLSDKAIKYFWMKTGFAKSGVFHFDEQGERLYNGADDDA